MKNQDLLPMSVKFDADPVVCRPRRGDPGGDCLHYHGRIEFGIKLCCGLCPSGPDPFAVDCPYKETA